MASYYSDQMIMSKLYGWHVYVISVPGFSKIGTAFNMKYRLASLQNGNPHPLKIEAIWHFKCRDEARRVESIALDQQGLNRIPRRDWCKCTPALAIAAVEYTIGMRTSAATLIEAGASA